MSMQFFLIFLFYEKKVLDVMEWAASNGSIQQKIGINGWYGIE